MSTQTDIREFLTSRRAKVLPEQVGYPAGGASRRVAGLRREEVAELAGISADYYIRLERGRISGVSESVLDAVARALLLDVAGRQHLFDLAALATQVRARPQRPPRHVRPNLLRLIDMMDAVPAMIQDHRTNILAMNSLANALYLDLGSVGLRDRNIARFVYLDERSPDFYADWTQSARDCVAMLRLASGRYPEDRPLHQLIGELSVRSEHFRQMWADHNVRHHTTGTKTLYHPVVGELTVTYESLPIGEDGQTLVTYTAEAGSASADALALLATWTASERPRNDQSRALAGE